MYLCFIVSKFVAKIHFFFHTSHVFTLFNNNIHLSFRICTTLSPFYLLSSIASRRWVSLGLCIYMDTKDIYHLLADHFDIIYFSARKLGFAKGGIITSKDPKYPKELMEFIPLYETKTSATACNLY